MQKFDLTAEFQANEHWLRSVLRARLHSQDEVDEVMQEVALAAVRQDQRKDAPPVERAGPWFYRVAVRQALLFRRKRGRVKKMIDGYATKVAPTEEDKERNPLEVLLWGERQSLVRESLARLPERDRELLLLKYVQNWKYQQIALELGVSESAVEARLHRARKKLRKILDQAEK